MIFIIKLKPASTAKLKCRPTERGLGEREREVCLKIRIQYMQNGRLCSAGRID